MEAAIGFEPMIEDLQSSALATWLCRPVVRNLSPVPLEPESIFLTGYSFNALRPCCQVLINFGVELKPDKLSWMVLKETYGEKISKTFCMTR